MSGGIFQVSKTNTLSCLSCLNTCTCTNIHCHAGIFVLLYLAVMASRSDKWSCRLFSFITWHGITFNTVHFLILHLLINGSFDRREVLLSNASSGKNFINCSCRFDGLGNNYVKPWL